VSFFHVLKVNKKITVITRSEGTKGGETKAQEKKPKDAAAIHAIFDKVVQEQVKKAKFDKEVREAVDAELLKA
jgi:hypothetical protein